MISSTLDLPLTRLDYHFPHPLNLLVSFLSILNLPHFQRICWLIIFVRKLQTQEHDMKERDLWKGYLI